jgi:hypothetical protein
MVGRIDEESQRLTQSPRMARSREKIDMSPNEAIKQSLDYLGKETRDRRDFRHLYQSHDSKEEEKAS